MHPIVIGQAQNQIEQEPWCHHDRQKARWLEQLFFPRQKSGEVDVGVYFDRSHAGHV